MAEDAIPALDECKRTALAELAANSQLVNGFIAADGGFRRSSAQATPTSSRTATAFAAFIIGQTQQGSEQVRSDLHRFLGALAPELGQLGLEPDDKDLNEYSVPIWTCGALAALRWGTYSIEALEALRRSVQWICDLVSVNNGNLRRVSASLSVRTPSAYLTYWATCALLLAKTDSGFLGLENKACESIDIALSGVARWSELELSRQIAGHHAGLSSRFDPIECLSAACIVAKSQGDHIPHLLDEAGQIAVYGMSVVFDNYFDNGSLRLSRPVFSDNLHNAILCPTSEALTMVLLSFSKRERLSAFRDERLGRLLETFEWCRRSRLQDGYPPDFDVTPGGGNESNLFSTVSSLGFFFLLSGHLDDLVDAAARSALGVSDDAPSVRFPYPDKLGDSVDERIIRPLVREPKLRAFAKHSMILHGPPGTAKTSLAKRIAADLGWPLKIITQSDFLRRGTALIDAEAERIFSLCSQLKNTVLLFDELEELVLTRHSQTGGVGPERESRLLTTSMLPKIHELRDRARVVFIFATNRLSSIDDAATRLGRFDIIYGVGYPNGDVLKEAAKTTLEKYERSGVLGANVLDRVKAVVESDIVQKTIDRLPQGTPALHLTYKDMEYVVESLAIMAKKENDIPALTRVVTDGIMRVHDENKKYIKDFERLKKSDRL